MQPTREETHTSSHVQFLIQAVEILVFFFSFFTAVISCFVKWFCPLQLRHVKFTGCGSASLFIFTIGRHVFLLKAFPGGCKRHVPRGWSPVSQLQPNPQTDCIKMVSLFPVIHSHCRINTPNFNDFVSSYNNNIVMKSPKASLDACRDATPRSTSSKLE